MVYFCLLSLCGTLAARAQSYPIASVEANSVLVAQSTLSQRRFDVSFNLLYSSPTTHERVPDIIQRNMQTYHWDCHNVNNYQVQVTDPIGVKPTVTIKLNRVGTAPDPKCSDAFVPGLAGRADNVFLWADEDQVRWHSISGVVTVTLLHLKDPEGQDMTLASKAGVTKVQWPLNIITASAQTVNNETLLDKSIYKKAIYQFPISSNLVLLGNNRSGLYVDTKDLFSTNERDSKSSFEGGIGYQLGMFNRWAVPAKLEGKILGNQVATNLSSSVSLQVSTNVPWGNFLSPPKRYLPAWNVAPAFSIALPYTHRFDQVVNTGSKPLPVDDFATNPSLALTTERLFEHLTTAEVTNGTSATFGLYWEGDLGLYYLPLQTTSKGSQRAEGYGDASILVPLADFGIIPGVGLDPTTQVNQMRLRIKYQDTVSATNNYVRTKEWTFGLELTVKK